MKDQLPQIQSLVAPDRCVLLERRDKQEAIGELVAALWRSVPTLDYGAIFGAIWDREVQLTTRISPEIAMPHAQITGMKESYICLGLQPEGIVYDPKDESLVQLLVLLVGPPSEHLRILSVLARMLEHEERLQKLLNARNPTELFNAFMTSGTWDSLSGEQHIPPAPEPKHPTDREAAAPRNLTSDSPQTNRPPKHPGPVPGSASETASLGTAGSSPASFAPGEADTPAPGPSAASLNPQDRLLLDSALHIAQGLEAQVLFIHLHHTLSPQALVRWFTLMQDLDFQRALDVRDLPDQDSAGNKPEPAAPQVQAESPDNQHARADLRRPDSSTDPESVRDPDASTAQNPTEESNSSSAPGLGEPLPREIHLIVVQPGNDGPDLTRETANPRIHQILTPSPRRPNRTNPVNLSILLGLSRGLLKKGQKTVSLFSTGGEFLDNMEVSDIDRDFGVFFSMPFHGASADTQMEVFMRVLQIASELAAEGREGKPVGTVFVMGDSLGIKPHCQQMVVNPFRGYDESERNVLDPGLTETLKEFSRIDGAIVIRGDGVITSAGTYLRVDRPVQELPAGLGARHTAAAGITAMTKAISIAISESTRQVSIFYGGERVMVI
ncbi:PTS sugar transporter subunit IIA [Spirochaeta lutea]|uniref:PTS sugar transporter subunit IIA n=1 Tax=Spirochaeta lutea TaxID=1480694 RepID=UPI00068D7954|nr:PTS sugar transporter subunit IIA [Spirochaeta lutea]